MSIPILSEAPLVEFDIQVVPSGTVVEQTTPPWTRHQITDEQGARVNGSLFCTERGARQLMDAMRQAGASIKSD